MKYVGDCIFCNLEPSLTRSLAWHGYGPFRPAVVDDGTLKVEEQRRLAPRGLPGCINVTFRAFVF